jgi:DNA-binding NarL/FixJ family response regulator
MADRIPRTGVLVVDDSEDFLTVACSWIESQPSLTLVGTARNGAEAQSAVDRLAPDLVIMDAFMPVVDGFAATRAIKARRAAPWVVMVSVHEGTTMEHEAWAAGADAFVAKANLADRLPDAIRDLRGGQATRLPTAAHPPARRPEDAPIEHRAVDARSLSARLVELVRQAFRLDRSAEVRL